MSRYLATVVRVWHVEVEAEDALAVPAAALAASRDRGADIINVEDIEYRGESRG